MIDRCRRMDQRCCARTSFVGENAPCQAPADAQHDRRAKEAARCGRTSEGIVENHGKSCRDGRCIDDHDDDKNGNINDSHKGNDGIGKVRQALQAAHQDQAHEDSDGNTDV